MVSARFFYRDPEAPAPTRPDRVVVVAFVERDDGVLLERRADCGQWCLIGGRVGVEAGDQVGVTEPDDGVLTG